MISAPGSPLLFLRDHQAPGLAALVRDCATTLGVANAFNPSLLLGPEGRHVAFRALPPAGGKPFHAYYGQSAHADGGSAAPVTTVLSLTEHAAAFGVGPVADPKLVCLNGAVYATFNTGEQDRQSANAVYLMRLAPTLGPPQQCVVLGDRQRIEKNWAFAPDGAQGLSVLYQLAPLTTLRLIEGALGAEGDLVFSRGSRIGGSAPRGRALSIGTQLLAVAGGLRLIGHEKVGIRTRRAYFGRYCAVDIEDGQFTGLRISRRRLLHSVRAALPHRPAHNRALISATYFAGLTAADDGRVALSYGINDVDFSVAVLAERALWR